MRTSYFIGIGTLCLLAWIPVAIADNAPEYEVVHFSDGITEFEVVQLMRYALHEPRWPGSQHFNAMLRGDVRVGDEYHYPNEPPGALPVDCNNTEMLGIHYLVKRTKKHQYRRKKLDVRYVWKHSNFALDNEEADYNRVYWYFKGESSLVLGESIELRDETKINGVISLEASIGSDVILRNSFELTGCPE